MIHQDIPKDKNNKGDNKGWKVFLNPISPLDNTKRELLKNWLNKQKIYRKTIGILSNIKKKKIMVSKPVIACFLGATMLGAGIFVTSVKAFDSRPAMQANLIKAYSIYYRGCNIGIVSERQEAEDILEQVRYDFEQAYEMETTLNDSFRFEEVLVEECFMTKAEALKKVVLANAEPKVKGIAMEIEGELVAILKDLELAESILNKIQEPYKNVDEDTSVKIETVEFAEDIKLTPYFTAYEQIEDPEMILQRLLEGTMEKESYIVKEGDSLWAIAQTSNMTVEEVRMANPPLKNSDILQIGMEINLTVPEMLLNVLTVEEIQYSESIPFETEVQKTSSLYTNQSKTTQAGKAGEQQVVAKIHKYNGIEKEREIISQVIVKEPTKKIVMQGTKKPVQNVASRGGSGTMLWPTRGTLTSGFGRRWGRLHAGIDIANSKGTPIYAAEAGTVSFSGSNGGYGNLVKINHSGNIVTYYGHMSSRAVKNGQKVQKGQLIGYMGSTGRSTGSHLHFEVRVNGTPVDPMKYLK